MSEPARSVRIAPREQKIIPQVYAGESLSTFVTNVHLLAARRDIGDEW